MPASSRSLYASVLFVFSIGAYYARLINIKIIKHRLQVHCKDFFSHWKLLMHEYSFLCIF
jgi:hypothetical protein